ncbi:MAG: T9SS type A sorting domain-containing protein [Ignavibacteriaceae bacterium]|nr:T9SS type A sorting domain-containing protein [Ignavibacteriaceae bacterium]
MRSMFFFVLMLSFLLFASAVNGSEKQNYSISNQNSDSNPSEVINLAGLPPVGNQVVAGSCYAWAAAYYYLSHLQWQEYGWNVNDPANQCSPAFVYNLTNGGVDNGAWEGDSARHDAFEVFETLGCATMEDLPYHYTTYRDFPTETAFRNGMEFRTLSTHHIETRTDSGLQVLKDHLLAGNLAVLGIYGYQNLSNIHNYNNIYCQSQATGGRLYWHEVTIIGYNDTLVTAEGIGAFRLVNSWGTAWGDAGFFWMSYEAVKHTQTSYGYAMYATDRVGYQPLITSRLEVGHFDRYNLVYKAGYGNATSPDTLLSFFDFSPMSLQTGIAYPDEGTIVLDLTDMTSLIQGNGSNEIFIRIEDDAPYNNHSGFVKSLTIEDLDQQLCVQSLNIPILISDEQVGAEDVLDLEYSVSTPQNLSVDPIPLDGWVTLNWDAPSQPNNLIGYGIYLNGRLIDTTSSNTYDHFLSIRGTNYYDVTALFQLGESLGAMEEVIWEGPTAYGIPFSDSFESGFGEWYQMGSSGIPSTLTDGEVYAGQLSAQIKSTEFDNTGLVRPFDLFSGADIETWFKVDTYPIGNMGAGGCVFLMDNGLILGTFIDPYGHPGYVYSTSPGNIVPVHLDSSVTIDPADWYKQKLWYYNGKFQFMLIDSDWNVILNRALDVPVQNVSQIALFAQGLNNGWNHFDKFSITPWDEGNLVHFNPVASTDNPYAFIITEASIDTSILEPGDEIAIYDGNLCVGAVIVDGEWPLEMNAWEADSLNPGFVSGNSIIARVWSNQDNLEYETIITFEVSNGNFGDGMFSRLSIEGTNIVSVSNTGTSVLKTFSMSQNYPNPFNPSTKIKYEIPEKSIVNLKLYDILGNEVTTLVNNENQLGRYEVEFNAANLPSGVYLYRIQTNNFVETKKMILLK